VTDVLGGATLVAAGLTVYALFATAPKTEQEAVKPGVTAFVGPASLGLSGRF
jgi:acyl-CoA-binding protein